MITTKTLGGTALIALFGIAMGIVYFFPPAEYSIYPKCLFFQYTGLYCPGCGGLRATHHLVHGRIADACKTNGLTTLLLPTLLAVLIWQKCIVDRKKAFLHLSAPPVIYWFIAFSVIVFAVARNLPWPPFSWLAPH